MHVYQDVNSYGTAHAVGYKWYNAPMEYARGLRFSMFFCDLVRFDLPYIHIPSASGQPYNYSSASEAMRKNTANRIT